MADLETSKLFAWAEWTLKMGRIWGVGGVVGKGYARFEGSDSHAKEDVESAYIYGHTCICMLTLHLHLEYEYVYIISSGVYIILSGIHTIIM